MPVDSGNNKIWPGKTWDAGLGSYDVGGIPASRTAGTDTILTLKIVPNVSTNTAKAFAIVGFGSNNGDLKYGQLQKVTYNGGATNVLTKTLDTGQVNANTMNAYMGMIPVIPNQSITMEFHFATRNGGSNGAGIYVVFEK